MTNKENKIQSGQSSQSSDSFTRSLCSLLCVKPTKRLPLLAAAAQETPDPGVRSTTTIELFNAKQWKISPKTSSGLSQWKSGTDKEASSASSGSSFTTSSGSAFLSRLTKAFFKRRSFVSFVAELSCWLSKLRKDRLDQPRAVLFPGLSMNCLSRIGRADKYSVPAQTKTVSRGSKVRAVKA